MIARADQQVVMVWTMRVGEGGVAGRVTSANQFISGRV